jgi:hypothetical protein
MWGLSNHRVAYLLCTIFRSPQLTNFDNAERHANNLSARIGAMTAK